MSKEKANWFETWFDTLYYHILYRDRDEKEAERFIIQLLSYLILPKKAKCLDLACGKGRHSIFLNKQGLDVIGLDLSENSINEAKEYENETLHFDVHDMRSVYEGPKFDCIFNLFTSFGYFDTYDDNLKVIKAVHEMLQPNGFLVIDFMNAYYVLNHLVDEEIKRVDDIEFRITRTTDNINIYKNIDFSDKGKKYHFQEKVQIIKMEEFELMLSFSGFEIINIFGNYLLESFDKEKSTRLIIIARKK